MFVFPGDDGSSSSKKSSHVKKRPVNVCKEGDGGGKEGKTSDNPLSEAKKKSTPNTPSSVKGKKRERTKKEKKLKKRKKKKDDDEDDTITQQKNEDMHLLMTNDPLFQIGWPYVGFSGVPINQKVSSVHCVLSPTFFWFALLL